MSDWSPTPKSQPPAPPWGRPPDGPPEPAPSVFEPPGAEPSAAITAEVRPLPPQSRPVTAPSSVFEAVPLAPPESLPYPSDRDPHRGAGSDDRPKRRIWPKVAGVAAAFALLGAGVTAGYIIAENDDSEASEAVEGIDEPVSLDEEPAEVTTDPTIPVQPGPVSEGEVEPVAAVAAAVAQSVVRIDTNSGTGSGIIYDDAGLIVTNAHVVQGVTAVNVQLADGTRLEGTVVGSDPSVDVAVVSLDSLQGVTLVPAVFAPTSTVDVGQLAVAIGSPFGLEQCVTAGIISAVSRAIQSSNVADGSPTIVEMVQTDAPINPGNSGGALADREGRVVGMNTSIRTDGTTQGNLGVGFAIPSDTLLLIAQRIVNGEALESGFLGVSGQDPSTGPAGALVTEVVAGGPADAAGLEVGDLIVSIDGQEVAGMTELAAKIRITEPESDIVVEALREGQPVELTVTLGTLGQS